MLFESLNSLTGASLTRSIAAGFFVLVWSALVRGKDMLIADSIWYLRSAPPSTTYTFTL